MEPTEEAGVEQSNSEKPGLGPLVQIDEGRIQSHLGEVGLRCSDPVRRIWKVAEH